MRKITLIILLLTTFLCGRAQDFLTPESYGIYSSELNGTENLFRLLFTGLEYKGSATWEAQYKTYYLRAPSFSPEYALIIEKDQLVLNKAEKSIWRALSDYNNYHKPDPMKIVSVKTMTLPVSEETCRKLSTLFKYTTLTATHLEKKPHGFDGTRYYFNYKRNLASVWVPREGRTTRLVCMADSLCYAVQHHDTALVNRQMKVCKALTQEFKKEFPERYFKAGNWSIQKNNSQWFNLISCDECIRLEIPKDNTPDAVIPEIYSDSLSAWSREIFLMNDSEEYPTVVIDNQRNNPFCEVTIYNDRINREIAMPEQYWRREVILQAAQLPPGKYYWVINGQWVNDKDLQPTGSSNTSYFDKPDCVPEYPGGTDSLYAFLKENVHRPEGAQEVNGTVLVEFVVEVDGSISEPKILKSLTPELDAEAIRVVKLMPKFIWHSEYCTIKRVYFNIPFKFVTE
ncbi:MAG: energy transducer TonB [Bacteroidales bacterium]|nr:energy transducer TonB [Bacteroidales bacterium]